MSLCDDCVDPGHCCRSFEISATFPIDVTREEVRKFIETGERPSNDHMEPMPMMRPLNRSSFWASAGQKKPTHCRWSFRCENLDEQTGRCVDYENRPRLCRAYEPGETALCVRYQGPWKGKLYMIQEKR